MQNKSKLYHKLEPKVTPDTIREGKDQTETKKMERWHWVSLMLGRIWLFGYGSRSPYVLSREFLTLPNWSPSRTQSVSCLRASLAKEAHGSRPPSISNSLYVAQSHTMRFSWRSRRGLLSASQAPIVIKNSRSAVSWISFFLIFIPGLLFLIVKSHWLPCFLGWQSKAHQGRQVPNDCLNSWPPCAVSQHHLVCLDSIGQKIHLKFSAVLRCWPYKYPLLSFPSPLDVQR